MNSSEIGGGDTFFLRRKKRTHTPTGRPLRIVDLFAGCGGMTLGMIEAARSLDLVAEVVLSMELRPEIQAVYRNNFSPLVEDDEGDVTSRFDGSIDARLTSRERQTSRLVGHVDVLVGGPPCQGHSNLNNHTRWSDPKNALYLAMVRAAEVLEPSAIVVENVPGVRKDKSGVLHRALERLTALGYNVDEDTVALADIGVPQRRIRHVLLATSKGSPDVGRAVESHAVHEPRTLRWAIGDLQPAGLTECEPFDSAAQLSSENLTRARWLLEHDKYDLPNDLRPQCHRNPNHKYKSMYGRLRWDEPAHTITTGFGSPGQGRYLHPDEPRTLTPHEAARLQFFPDWFDFGRTTARSVLATCIGNAVPPKLAYALGREVIELTSRRARRTSWQQMAFAP